MKFNWLFFLIVDGICGSLILAHLYSILWGPIKQGKLIEHNEWMVSIICLLVPIFFHVCVRPFSYFLIDKNGIGSQTIIGISNYKLLKIASHYVKWADIKNIDYLNSPIWNGLEFYYHNKKGFRISFLLFTNKKKAIKILLEKLPRNNISPNAMKYFFEKWERKLAKEEIKND